jgi:hypothetical protein
MNRAWCTTLFAVAMLAAPSISSSADPSPMLTIPGTQGSPKAPGSDAKALHDRLASVDSADVSRACGNISAPWAYRGPRGQLVMMRSYGRLHADRGRAQALADLLMRDATVDDVWKIPSIKIACDPVAGEPVYLARLYAGKRSTFALLRLDLAAVVFFDAEEPLGMILMKAKADSLWAMLAGLRVPTRRFTARGPNQHRHG